MPNKLDASGQPGLKPGQKPTLATSPGMREHTTEQQAIAANTERLRALRLAKENAEPKSEKAPTKRAARAKPAVRRGIGST